MNLCAVERVRGYNGKSLFPGGVMMGSGDHGSTSGGPTNADESNLLMISPAATGVINLPVQPTTFAPVDIPTSEVS